ncbi:hypothetical protein HK16_10560 [Acetobacter senegalensis]|uniref:Uncharacterized protein n=2 Tax=Acetobacter TaxID=434 RepID=A0A252EIK5_9PROT|nr:hypothetical protein CIW82_00580 [Acetobacter tropicalis]OUL66318.1 hypothetical protein HK16_10560 [Acetobacter senegalensis]
MADFRFKRSGTFLLTCLHMDDVGAPLDLDGATVSAELRDTQNDLVASLEVTPVTDQVGTYVLSYDGDTSGWPLGLLRTDVKAVLADGTISHTDTVTIVVVDRVTQ